MAKYLVQPTGSESPFEEEELIVSKTDLTGRITYANDVFLRVSGFPLKDLIGAPHSIIRHPDMPRSVFKLLWDTLQQKHEIFAYVLNMARNGDHYWVLAHVTPSFDAGGNVTGYHSNRRKPEPEQIAKVKDIYDELLRRERSPENRKEGMLAAFDWLVGVLRDKGVAYDEFVFAL